MRKVPPSKSQFSFSGDERSPPSESQFSFSGDKRSLSLGGI